jgi:SAM-dependent methyltransferase
MVKTDIFEHFVRKFDEDRQQNNIPEWTYSWYWKELNPQFGSSKGYTGPIELLNWYVGQSSSRTYPNLINDQKFEIFLEKSVALDQQIFANPLFLEHEQQRKKLSFKNYGVYNAQDYFFQTLTSHMFGKKMSTVLDFGSGSGRQLNLWSQDPNLQTFISIDAMPQNYCMQNLYYQLIGVDLIEYVWQEQQFEIKNSPNKTVFHLPSWRLETIPDNFVDLIISVQVLGELRPEMTDYVIAQFQRILVPGGVLYVRDHGKRHNPNKVDIKNLIHSYKFHLEFEPDLEDLVQIHGIPKVWRKK